MPHDTRDSPGRRLADHTPPPRQQVLIVDDLPLNLAFAAAELEDLCTPLLASNGEQALQLAARYQPELILLDVRMPGMDGFEVCRRLKRNPATADIALIFLTALDDESDEETGLNLGAIDYIGKPFSPAILRARVRNHLLAQRQRLQLEQLSQRDGLTGIANRRSFDNALLRHWQRLCEQQQPLGLLLLDVDCFKAYNDHCGHLAGDEALKQVARCIDGQMQRSGDLAARFGGEEFACILPQTDSHGARRIAEAIRLAILDLHLAHPASPVAPVVSLSVGSTSLVPGPRSSPQELLGKADQYLYQAKNRGRNQVAGD